MQPLFTMQLWVVWKIRSPPVSNQAQVQKLKTIKTVYHYISHVIRVLILWCKQSQKKNHSKSMLKIVMGRPPYIIVLFQTNKLLKKQSCWLKEGLMSINKISMVGMCCTLLVLKENQSQLSWLQREPKQTSIAKTTMARLHQIEQSLTNRKTSRNT